MFPLKDGDYFKYLSFIVEIDGEYHNSKEQKLKDYERELNLLDGGKWSMVIHLTGKACFCIALRDVPKHFSLCRMITNV